MSSILDRILCVHSCWKALQFKYINYSFKLRLSPELGMDRDKNRGREPRETGRIKNDLSCKMERCKRLDL